MRKLALLALPLLVLAPCARLAAQQVEPEAQSRSAPETIAARCQAALDELHRNGDFPGGSAALILPDGTEQTFTVGVSEGKRKLVASDRLLSGSIGKTYVAAAAMRVMHADKLSLDDRVATHLGEHAWYARIPNHAEITVRDLMRHTTGIPRHVMKPGLWKRLIAEPDKAWDPPELLAFIFDTEPLFEAGEGFAYADTNFVLLGLVLEKVTETPIDDYIREHLLVPNHLRDTIPSDSREIPGLVQGHIGMCRAFGLPERALVDGVFVINPQFEGCGGGYANTPLDLARWARLLATGKAFDGEYLDAMLDGVDAPMFGRGGKYGLGVILRETDAGPMIGHDGVFPGYFSAMGYFPERKVAAAFQINRDGTRETGVRTHELLIRFAEIVGEELGGGK